MGWVERGRHVKRRETERTLAINVELPNKENVAKFYGLEDVFVC